MRYGRIAHCHSNGTFRRIFITLGLNGVKYIGRHRRTVHFDALINDFAQLLFTHKEINLKFEFILKYRAVHITQILRNRLIENHPTHCGIHQTGNL